MKNASIQYEAVIGLETHAQLATKSKIFACSATKSGQEANTLTDSVTLGLPGALPVLNKKVIEYAVKLGLATGCEINTSSVFARKHYFYPDLPKGYQISQFDEPICSNGHLFVSVESKEEEKKIRINRIHLEEDAGKSIHLSDEPHSVVDLNRAGVPLLEIVSEPDLSSSEEATTYMRLMRQLVRYLGICDGNLEEGSLRCDANISVRPVGTTKLGTKVEIKNLNSFRFVERAIDYEISRQTVVLQQGGTIVQETRLWDEQKGATKSMRTKEFADDYRYMPDPDLPKIGIEASFIDRIQSKMPELPTEVADRFRKLYKLDDYYALLLSEERSTAQFFDAATSAHYNPQALANWITTELFGRLHKEQMSFSQCPISPEHLGLLVKLIDEDIISGKIAKTVFDEMFSSGANPEVIVKEKGLTQVSDVSELEAIIKKILADNQPQAEEYRSGKTKMLGFFVGQVMKETKGKANPKLVNELLISSLKS
ncbi:UNVERIFIED_CONTAM: hypothetical protein GTU68_048469 [Idotea baltica]|nr:hypothetical protein [Idotea baltica]